MKNLRKNERRPDQTKKDFVDPIRRGQKVRNDADNFQLVCDMLDGKINSRRLQEWQDGGWYDTQNLVDKGLMEDARYSNYSKKVGSVGWRNDYGNTYINGEN